MKHLDLECQDTIAALLTGSSDGVLSVVRVSGPQALEVRDRVFVRRKPGPWREATLHLGDYAMPDGQPGGEAMCATFREGRSYTGEAAVEIHGFGGRINAARLLRAVLSSGARQAEPGEFTLRAWLHGKLSLDQAEAVASLMAAQSDDAVREAEAARHGGLGKALEPLRESMLALLAETEAYLDFPDDGLPAQRREAQRVLAGELCGALERLLRGHERSRRLLEGARVVLWGAPNAGKSTLMNALCGEGRSIVDEQPGTTRDVVEARVVWGGMPVTLVDTAGVREAQGRVEKEGVRRSLREAERADLVLACVACDADAVTGAPASGNVLVVQTKGDLGRGCGVAAGLAATIGCGVSTVSALAGTGVVALRECIIETLGGSKQIGEGGVVATNTRQAALMQEAIEALRTAVVAREGGEPEEAVAEWLRRAARHLGEVTGRSMPPEEVLGAIFSRFCIGK